MWQGESALLLITLLFTLLCLLSGMNANAHLLNMSRSTISVDAEGHLTIHLSLDLLVTVGSREKYYALSRHPAPLESDELRELLKELPDAIALRADDQPVSLEIAQLKFPAEEQAVFLDPLSWPRTDITLEGQVLRNAKELQVRYLESFRFEEPIANTFEQASTQRRQTRWLVTGQISPKFSLDNSSSVGVEANQSFAVFADLTLAGMRHIFPGGLDHLLFVTALLLGSRSIGQLVAVITLFTLAHSLSLAITTLGWVSAPAKFVEPLILLSIIWVAARGLFANSRLGERYLGIVIFGLIHGLGFAASLRELGLPPNHLLSALAGFNVGVEIAQLLVVALLAAVGFFLFRRGVELEPWRRGGYIAIIFSTFALGVVRFL